MAQGTDPVGEPSSAQPTDAQQIKCLNKNLRRIERAEKTHKKLVKQYIRRERAYKGDIDFDKDTWRHQVHPPFIFQNVETLEAQLVWDATITKVLPTKEGDQLAAESLEKLLRWQMDNDCLDQKWGMAVKSSLIYGPGIIKVHWGQRMNIVGYDDGTDETIVAFDQPTCDVIDPKDFFLDPNATSLANAKWCALRYYQDRDFIRGMGEPLLDEDGKQLEEPRWMNIDDALDSRQGDVVKESGKSHSRAQVDVEKDGLYECFEIWTRDKVVTIVNRKVLVQDDMTPFDHHELPFVDLYTIEDPFHFDKLSMVDAGIELQNARWEFNNQGLDAAALVNNPVVKVISSYDDPDSIRIEPGAVIEVDRMDDVVIESADNRVIGAFRQVDEHLERQMMNVMAANPFGPAAQENQVNPVTAAEVNAQQSINGARVQRARTLLGYSRERLGKLWIALNQQFLTEPETIRVLGPNGPAFHNVAPDAIQGRFDYYIESQQESTDRNARRTEWLNMFQTIAQLCGGVQNMEAQGFSVGALWDKLAAAHDIENPGLYYQKPPPPPVMPMAPPGAPAGAPPTTPPGTPPQ